jgi:hypothetical protein
MLAERRWNRGIKATPIQALSHSKAPDHFDG